MRWLRSGTRHLIVVQSQSGRVVINPVTDLALAASVRFKHSIAQRPPWKRFPEHGPVRVHISKLPDVSPRIDLMSCEDPELVADTICEVVPWKRKRAHHDWLHQVCARVRSLLPNMEPRDVVRIILAFGELHTKRRTHTLFFHDYETYSALFQSLPVEAATSKTLVPLLRVYRRMGVEHTGFFHAACDQVITGVVELQPSDVAELVQIHGDMKIRSPKLFEFVGEILDLRFSYFSEDQIGDMARAFCTLRYRCETFLNVLRRELPYRLHEYAWWNLIDIAEMYLDLQVDHREIVERIGNETFKLVYSMKGQYPAKALKVLAFLDTGDTRTFRLLTRALPQHIWIMSPQATAESILALAAIKYSPFEYYHRHQGSRLYKFLVHRLTRDVQWLSAKMTCDVFAALAQVQAQESEIALAAEAAVKQRPYKYHAEHIVSLLRDFATLRCPSADMRAMLIDRRADLKDCTPSALCAVPRVLAEHPVASLSMSAEARMAAEREMLSEVSALLCESGRYSLPTDPRAFRTKDELWWQLLRQRHFRLRRKAKARGVGVDPGRPAPQKDEDSDELHRTSPAIAHISRAECLELIEGSAQLDWRDQRLLDAVAAWLCSGRRHAELEPDEVARILGCFSSLDFAQPLLRAALEHALLRVASAVPAKDCARALRGSLDMGMAIHSAALRALLRRCAAMLPLVPAEDKATMRMLSEIARQGAEEEVLAGHCATRVPLEAHLFWEAAASAAGRASHA